MGNWSIANGETKAGYAFAWRAASPQQLGLLSEPLARRLRTRLSERVRLMKRLAAKWASLIFRRAGLEVASI
jgi:hypothetical protein